MNTAPKLVYVTNIRTTPAKLWEAIINPDLIEQYWFGARNISTWKTGDPIESHDEGELSWKGVILSCTPEKEVSYTFDHLTDEPPSTVRFLLEPMGEEVRLTVIHEDFQEVSPIRDRVSNGWPKIVAGIKALLETGSVEQQAGNCKCGHD